MKKEISRKFCVAPMMGYTTPYARKLYRILSRNSFLFSEMIATKSLIYSKSKNNIIDNDFNNHVAIQVVDSEIKDIKLDDHGQPVIVTSKGEKKALSFRLVKLDEGKS